MFSFIVGQLYAFAPFLVDVHFALRQLHHDVRGLEAGIVGQVGTDAESAANFAATVFLYVKGFAEETPFAPLLFKSKTVLTPSGLVDGMTPTASDPFYGFADWRFHLSGSES